jgi:hypothetical protein
MHPGQRADMLENVIIRHHDAPNIENLTTRVNRQNLKLHETPPADLDTGKHVVIRDAMSRGYELFWVLCVIPDISSDPPWPAYSKDMCGLICTLPSMLCYPVIRQEHESRYHPEQLQRLLVRVSESGLSNLPLKRFGQLPLGASFCRWEQPIPLFNGGINDWWAQPLPVGATIDTTHRIIHMQIKSATTVTFMTSDDRAEQPSYRVYRSHELETKYQDFELNVSNKTTKERKREREKERKREREKERKKEREKERKREREK